MSDRDACKVTQHDTFPLKEYCKGCLSVNVNVVCNFRLFRNTEDCPCRMCLVKVMCNDGCERLHEARRNIFPEYRKERVGNLRGRR